jgi:hypothetical protein
MDVFLKKIRLTPPPIFTRVAIAEGWIMTVKGQWLL